MYLMRIKPNFVSSRLWFHFINGKKKSKKSYICITLEIYGWRKQEYLSLVHWKSLSLKKSMLLTPSPMSHFFIFLANPPPPTILGSVIVFNDPFVVIVIFTLYLLPFPIRYNIAITKNNSQLSEPFIYCILW